MLVLIIGPSGVGKDTIVGELCKKNPDNYKCAISATTRPMRDGEVDGKNYYFLTKEEFQEKIDNGELVEWAEYNKNFYGTLKSEVESAKVVLLIVEIQGALEIKEKISCLSIFLLPPFFDSLEERLIERGTENEDEILARLLLAKEEISKADKFDAKITNDNLYFAVSQIKNLINSWED